VRARDSNEKRPSLSGSARPARLGKRIIAVLVPTLLSWCGLELVGQSYFGRPYYYGKF
jgi:hypothetical protein